MNVKSENGKLFIVGSGPGDPKLLTLAALETIKSADVILYDNLVNKSLLNFAKKTCIKVFVGKKPYENTISQSEINDLIRFYALSVENIVRLKGGDPHIFGRGYEELQFAKENNICASYIPGISSMQTTGLHDIPLTYRGISTGVWAITGTRKDGSLAADLHLAARSTSTIVIYMGMSKLAEIAQIYQEAGKGHTSACIIENGSLETQRKLICKVKDLNKEATRQNFANPAIIVIGDVVALAEEQETLEELLIGPLDESKNFFEG
ncbi:uroporphyrinogen-III C-methyltransferase [Albibacterium profundi]|uniref:uroporphyrinogen-III C-methyltransferase n=1 Tax=Albibacterium profundi TaxID=3134906 RepID=A0ABV5CC28_9SPHI